MAKGKKTTVVLQTADGTTETFEINHAERILRLANNGGWSLPENSPFKFDRTNGIEIRGTKGGNKSPEKNEGNKQSEGAPSQD